MMVYIIEFVILHVLFFLVYKTLLANETQITFIRYFIIGSTILSLVIPAVELPNSSTIPSVTSSVVLPIVSAVLNTPAISESHNWMSYFFYTISAVFGIKLFVSLIKIFHYYQKSQLVSFHGIFVRKVDGLKTSFTFFQWIFLDSSELKATNDILNHELGHVKKYHSLDNLFFNLLIIPFWWVPTIWLNLKDLRVLHEYEADAFALRKSNKTYINTLVHSTLKANGISLTSSFDDASIFNRLNFIKKMKKKINGWKMASIVSVVAICVIVFACDDKIETEVDNITSIAESYPNKFIDQLADLERLGLVILEFKVANDGSLSKIKVKEGKDAESDAEAIRLLESSP